MCAVRCTAIKNFLVRIVLSIKSAAKILWPLSLTVLVRGDKLRFDFTYAGKYLHFDANQGYVLVDSKSEAFENVPKTEYADAFIIKEKGFFFISVMARESLLMLLNMKILLLLALKTEIFLVKLFSILWMTGKTLCALRLLIM